MAIFLSFIVVYSIIVYMVSLMARTAKTRHLSFLPKEGEKEFTQKYGRLYRK